MDPTNIDLSHQKTQTHSFSICVEFLIEKNIKWKKEEAKTRPENNAKHEMDWVEKTNIRFEKQKMSLENEKRKWIHPHW